MPSYRPQYRATMYAPRTTDVTETTVLMPAGGAPHSDAFQVSTMTGVVGWQPYLDHLQGRRGRLDLLKKKVDVGHLRLTLLDQRTTVVGSNLSRWVTAFLGDANGNPNWAGLRVKVEESLDNGATWASFFVGRTTAVRLLGKARIEIDIEDATAALARMKIFTTPPHPDASPVNYWLWPVNIDAAYGALPASRGVLGRMSNRRTVTINGQSVVEADFNVDSTELIRVDNAVLTSLLDRSDPMTSQETALNGIIETHQSEFNSFIGATLKREDNAQTGLFHVGVIVTQLAGTSKALSIPRVVLRERAPAKGTATGTPLVAGAHSPSDTTIDTDGWTINITGIVKANDVIRFLNHATNYRVVSDANSNGSGAATITISPGLTTSVPDNTVIAVGADHDRLAMPANDTLVRVALLNFGPLNDAAPALVNDRNPFQIWKDALDGYYGRRWKYGEKIPSGKKPGDPKETIPYDSAAFSTLITQTKWPRLRLKETKAVSAAEWIEEQICQPLQVGYYIDAAGQLVPVDLGLPTALGGLPTITNADLASVPDAVTWSHDAKGAITRYVLKFYEDYTELTGSSLVQALSKLFGTPTSLDSTLAKTQTEHRIELLELAAAAQADNELTVDARGCRVMRDADTIDLGKITAVPRQFAARLMHLTRPYARGPQIVALKLSRGAAVASASTTLPGKAVIVDVDELPDAGTHLRGGARLVRITERTEESDGLVVTLRAVDLGASLTSGTPTLGTPAQQTGNTTNGAQVTVSALSSGYPCEVHAALTATSVGSAPAEDSPLWFLVKTVTVAGDVALASPVPSNRRVWFRGRSFPITDTNVLALPSAWVAAGGTGYVDTAALSAPSNVVASQLTATTALVTWTLGTASREHAVYLVTPTTDPLELIARVAPGVNRIQLRYLTLSTQYKVEVRAIDGLGGESAGANTTFTTSSTQPTAPAAGGIVIIVADGVTL